MQVISVSLLQLLFFISYLQVFVKTSIYSRNYADERNHAENRRKNIIRQYHLRSRKMQTQGSAKPLVKKSKKRPPFSKAVDKNQNHNVQNQQYELSQIFLDINNYRKKRRLEPFIRNKKLDEAAAIQSKHMAQTKTLSHTGPKGLEEMKQRIEYVGYDFSQCCENLAQMGTGIQRTVPAWIKSDGHRKNLERDCKEVGLAVETTPDKTDYVAMVAASPLR